MTVAPTGREPRFELHLQLPRRHVVLRLGKLHMGLGVIELDEIDVAEDVVAVGAFIAVAFRKGIRSSSVPVEKAHDWIKQRMHPSKGLTAPIHSRKLAGEF